MSTTPALDPGAVVRRWLDQIKGSPSADPKVLAAQQQWAKTFENSPITKFALAQLNRTPADLRAQTVADAEAAQGVQTLANANSLSYQRGVADITKDLTSANTENLGKRDTTKTDNLLRVVGAYSDSDLAHRQLDVSEGEKFRQFAAEQAALDRQQQKSLMTQGLVGNILGGLAQLGAAFI